MLITLIRAIKRLAVLVPGLVIAYLSVFNIFPLLNDHLPVVVAVLITYILGAYVLIPALTRLLRILFPPKHVPLYCVTADGFASDPLNIGLIGTRQELIEVMQATGWHGTDRLTPRTGVRAILSTIYDWRYSRAPMSNLYLFGRKQDENFQIPIKGALGSRHHVRFWATTFHDGKELDIKTINWQHRQEHVRDDRLLWVGAASRDVGVTFIRHNAQLTHLVDSDTNSERDLIVKKLEADKLAKLNRTISLGEPYKLLNIHALRGHIHTDGRMTVMNLTPKTAVQNSNSSAPQLQK